MRRGFFNVVSAISLLACIVTLTLWVPGEFSRRTLQLERETGTITLHSGAGQAHFLYSRSAANVSAKPRVELLGFRFFTVITHGTDNRPRNDPGYAITVLAGPLWPAAAIFAILPLWAIISMTSRQRITRLNAEGMCESCSYDLTANNSGVCPECGTTVTQKTTTVG